MTIKFWSNNPSVLFNKEHILELWPTMDMCYEQKLNSITRLIIFITFLGYILTMSERILIVGALSLAVIFVLFNMRKQKFTKDMFNEGFDVGTFHKKDDAYINPITLESVLKTEFKGGTKKTRLAMYY